MEIRKGSRVIVRSGFGVDAPKEVEVIRIDSKNGQPLIEYDNRWAYFHQIDEVIKF